MNEVRLYWLPHCSTCQKAREFIEQIGVTINKIHDLKAHPLSREEVFKLANLVGGADKLFSRRAKKYRELGLPQREVSSAEMLELMSSEYTFIKRPVLVIGESGVAGFAEKIYREMLPK